MNRRLSNVAWPVAGFALILAVLLWAAARVGADLLSHSPYDSYTLQALAWRDGRIALGQNYPWLELANYKGDYWVSFPPLPAVVMWVLTFPFGEDTPSATVNLAYFFGGLAALYALLRRALSPQQSTIWTVFAALGGSLLWIAVPGGDLAGGVWFQAELLAFLLTALALLLVGGTRRWQWAAGLTCLALAVACRPFHLIYFPVLLWILRDSYRKEPKTLIPLLAGPVVVGAVLAVYNAVRFGSPFEFGHSYLPEFQTESMFQLGRVWDHVGLVMQLPTLQNGQLTFPLTGGFAIYLTNPILLVAIAVILFQAARRRIDVTEMLILGAMLVHAVLLLSHRTNGGYQYGTRYFTDLLPIAIYVVARRRVTVGPAAAIAVGALIAFNVFASVVFSQTTQ